MLNLVKANNTKNSSFLSFLNSRLISAKFETKTELSVYSFVFIAFIVVVVVNLAGFLDERTNEREREKEIKKSPLSVVRLPLKIQAYNLFYVFSVFV